MVELAVGRRACARGKHIGEVHQDEARDQTEAHPLVWAVPLAAVVAAVVAVVAVVLFVVAMCGRILYRLLRQRAGARLRMLTSLSFTTARDYRGHV